MKSDLPIRPRHPNQKPRFYTDWVVRVECGMSVDVRFAGIFGLLSNQKQPAKPTIPTYPAGFGRLYRFSRSTACQPMSRRQKPSGQLIRSIAA